MTQEYLLTFLEHGVIDLNGDDTRLEKLRSTATDLSSTLLDSPSRAIRYTLVAADPNILSTDPTIEEAMQALRAQWTTVANAYKGGYPVAILRAILLEALVQSARKEDSIAVAFVNTARNALAYSESSSESPVWKAAVSEIETKVDARAESEWATPEMITVSPLRYKASVSTAQELEAPVVDRDELKQKIRSAAGPGGSTPSNQYHSHSPPQWANEFSPMMGDAIANSIDEIAAKLTSNPIDISGPLSALAKAVAGHVDKALTSFSGATAGLQRRTNLLWWKEALYSPSVHESYLELPAFEAAALMALDLHQQVPSYSPASVSAFLKEAIRSLQANDEEQEFSKLLHEARTTEFMQPFRTLAAEYAPSPNGRGPVLSLIGYPQSATIEDTEALLAFSGIESQHKLDPIAWGAYLFRELQSARAIQSEPLQQTEKS
ncbi:GTPase-associated system all-helical protein GASH [Kangiella sp.]|uniref:GTPase-associated system all-helical protein GASH n=1 Tax=Kangiella sp. TaxID=1920245 RepID=UPI003A91C9A4